MVATLRDALGAGPRLRIDVNSSWSVPQAVRMLERLAQYDIDFVEQPVRETPRGQLGELRRRSPVARVRQRGPVVARTTRTRASRAREADVYCFSPYWVGSLAAFARLAHVAAPRGPAGLQAHPRRARHHGGGLPARAADAAERGRGSPADGADDGARRAQRADPDRHRRRTGASSTAPGSASRWMPTPSPRRPRATAARASTCPGSRTCSGARAGPSRGAGRGEPGSSRPAPSSAFSERVQRSEFATCSRRSIATCMPDSIPEAICASRCSLHVCWTRIESVVRPSTSVSVSVSRAAASGHALVDLGRDDPLVRDDLAELAVEADLEAAFGHHHVAPHAADPQVDLGERHLAVPAAPPALDELGRGPRLVHQMLGRVELPRDEDLLIGRERHLRRPTTGHCHLLLPPA